MNILREVGVPRSLRLWTTQPDTGITDPRVPIVRDENNAGIASRLDTATKERWFMLSGAVGRGKTTLVTAAFNDWVAARINRFKDSGSKPPRRRPAWITESGIFHSAAHSGNIGVGGREIYLRHLSLTPLLVVDDLGGGRRNLTEWQGAAMRHLIAERHAELRPTLFTTNLKSWDEIERRYGDHIASRMIEAAQDMIIMGGPDRRLRGGKLNG